MGDGLPDRRRAGGICARALRGQRTDRHSGRSIGRGGAVYRRPALHRLLGRIPCGDPAGGHGGGDRRGAYGPVLHDVRKAVSARAHHRHRRGRQPSFAGKAAGPGGRNAQPPKGRCGEGGPPPDGGPRGGRRAGGRGRKGYLPDGMADRQTQRGGSHHRHVRGAADFTPSGHVRKESDL